MFSTGRLFCSPLEPLETKGGRVRRASAAVSATPLGLRVQLRREAASERGLRGAQEPGVHVLHELVVAAGMYVYTHACVRVVVGVHVCVRVRGVINVFARLGPISAGGRIKHCFKYVHVHICMHLAASNAFGKCSSVV